uniref:probable E3 ubiquitin-protein ligase HERC4 n=1 Tax=Pristiophorus japonicus TaxID=55135 RepID=UPI00398E34D3
MFRWGELSCRLLGSKSSKDRILSQATYSGAVFENEEIEYICCRARFSVFVLSDGRVYTLVNEQRWRGQPELVNGLQEHKIHAVDSGTSHILFVSEAGNVFLSEFQKNKRGANTKLFKTAEPQLLRDFAEICVIQVACGNNHSLALCKDGQVFAWGQNSRGQLGVGKAGRSVPTPRGVTSLAGVPLAQIAAGGSHSFALSVSGAVFAWGSNDHGQLGLNDMENRYHPTEVKLLDGKKMVYISCGGQHTATLTKDGLVFTFGAGRYGQLGHNTTTDELKPQLVEEFVGSKVTQIACGSYHTLVLVATSGKIYSFGRGVEGQLGNGRTSHQSVPRPVTFSMDVPDRVRLAPAAMSRGDSEPTVPERRRRVTRAAAAKANTHKRTIAAQDAFPPTGDAAKRMRIGGARGATPKFTKQPVAQATRAQCPTAPSGKYHRRSQLTQGRVPPSPRAKAGMERVTSVMVTDAHPNTQDCPIQPAVRRIFAGANQGFALCIGDTAPVSPEGQSVFTAMKRIAIAEDWLLNKWDATGHGELRENIKQEIDQIFSSAASLNGSFLETSEGNHFKTSSVDPGVDMSAVTLWFEKLGKNPTLLQEVTNAVENKLIPSLSKSPAGVEALRVYLVLPELIDVLMEHTTVVKLTSLLSTAIVSLEESQLEILAELCSSLEYSVQFWVLHIKVDYIERRFTRMILGFKGEGNHFKTSSVDPGVDMSAVTLWFEKLGKNPTLLQEVTNAVENKLIPSLSKSPAGVEALRVYLVLPELIDVLMEHTTVVKLTSLLSTAIVSLEESQLEILESWWSHLNEFFFTKLVMLYKSVSYRLLRESSRETKEFPDKLCNCLNIFQRLYKINSTSSLKIQENTFYISPAEVFGGTSISCIAMLQLIPYNCIFNMENKIKIFQRVSHLRMQRGIIVDEKMNFGNSWIIDVSTGNIGVSTGNIGASTGNIDVSTGNIDVSTGNIGASTGNIEASTENTDASTGNIDASTGNIDASTGNIDVSTGNIDASTGNVDASTGNIEASTGNIDASTGNIEASTGNIDASTWNIDASTGNTEASTGNIEASTGNIETSMGNIDVSTGIIEASTRNIDGSTGNTDVSTGIIETSAGNIEASTGNIDVSTGNIEASTGNIDVSTGNIDVSTGNSDVSTGNIDASTGNINASTGNIDASTGNIDVSTGNINASTGNVDVSTGNIDASTGNIDVSTGNIDVSTGNIDASVGNTEASTGIIDVSTGNIDVSTGNIEASTGNIEASTGNIDASNGNIEASTGNIDASTGNTDASTGNIDASTGNIEASIGNIDVSTGNIDASTGNIDASTENIEASTGNIDASTGNIDASTGNIDAFTGHTFDFSDEYDDDDCVDFDFDDVDYDSENVEDLVPTEDDLNFLLTICNLFLPRCFLLINRPDILQNTLAQLRCCSDIRLRGLLQVKFVGESGIDEGGVSQEFFSIITKELCTLPKAFKLYEESRLVWFPEWEPEIADLFRLVGILCWLALYHGLVADFHFPLALYKKLLRVRPTLDDLKELSPTVGQNLQELLNYENDDIEDVFCQDFTVGREMDDGSIVEHELIPNGKNIPVQKHNRRQFVDAYVDYVFNTSVQKHFKAFSEGFRWAVPLPVVDVFLPVELMAVIHGNTKYDWQLLEEHTKYQGYTKADQNIVTFWEMFHELTEDEKKHFLAFLTGCERVPVGGMGSLSITIRREMWEDPDLYFPVAHTCNWTLDLPQYSSGEILRERFLRAIGCCKGFGIA